MWINHSAKAVWYEIPKNASSSIKKLLGIAPPYLSSQNCRQLIPALMRRHFDLDEFIFLFSFSGWTRPIAIDILEELCRQWKTCVHQSQFGSNLDNPNWQPFYGSRENLFREFGSYFSFAIFRNPEQRLASTWAMFNEQEHRRQVFMDLFDAKPDAFSFQEAFDLFSIRQNHHFNPQYVYLPPHQAGKLPDMGLLTTVGELKNTWPKLAKRLGVTIELAHKNKTGSGVSIDLRMPSDSLKQHIRDHYFSDHQLFARLPAGTQPCRHLTYSEAPAPVSLPGSVFTSTHTQKI
ncbi:MAG: sulfotransferase family 2 domain-containing protein [Lentisphaeria bacterium]|nr:sulfotransferase family 2 domain-containing protein [Lentisphaeria bacterium]